MPTFHSHLHYRNVDVSTIKEMARRFVTTMIGINPNMIVQGQPLIVFSSRWYPDDYEKQPKKHGDHRALGDIEESIKELQYYKEKVFKK